VPQLGDVSMPEAAKILQIEDPHFTVRLYEDFLKVNLKGSFKNDVEEALENKPVLKRTIGAILSVFVPLNIRLKDIDSVNLDEEGKLKIVLPHRRDIVLPLERKDAEHLIEKLNEWIPKAKKKELKRIIRSNVKKRRKKSKSVPLSSYRSVPYYFPTEQVDIVNKLRRKKKRKK
jgi:hypothetical protein